MSFVITSDTSKQYLLEEDAVKGFEMAVLNGQSRLALTILVDVVNGIMEVFNAMMEEAPVEEQEKVENTEKPVVENQDKKKIEPKPEAKKEAAKEPKNS